MDLFGLASIPNNLHKELIVDEKNNNSDPGQKVRDFPKM